MKKIMKSTAVLALATVGLFSFKAMQTASIKGTVAPADGFTNVWAINGTDSLKATTADQGAFSFTDAKPGTYQVVVEGKAPYRNFVKDSVVVTDGQPVDLGTITLEQ